MNEPEIVIEGASPEVENPWDKPDQSAKAPDLIPYLLPDETIISVHQVPRLHKNHLPSSLKELFRLTQSVSSADVGDHGPVIAGTSLEDDDRIELHLFEAVFGRDSLRVASDLLEHYPKLAKATLIKLASLQGQEWNTSREEEPGRIPHEIRDLNSDVVAQRITAKHGWGWPYYGSVDATPEFIRVFSAYSKKTKNGMSFLGDNYQAKDGSTHVMADALADALRWVEQRMDANPEGFVEFKAAFPGSIENQVWRDSWDAYSHADGTIANHQQGIASVGVQTIVYDALLDVAGLYEGVPDKQGEAELLVNRAELLREQVMKHFWTDKDGGFFVLGTDRDEAGNLRQLDVKTSDMGHLLDSRLLMGDNPEVIRRREAVVRQLFSPTMLATGGVRTLANTEIRFRPGAYHNGNVWLWDNYLIAQGLRLHGYHSLAHELDRRILADMVETNEFPEFVRGGDGKLPEATTRVVDIWDAKNRRVNRIEQPPQEVQAWSVAALLSIKIANNRRFKQYGRAGYKPSVFEAELLEGIERVV